MTRAQAAQWLARRLALLVVSIAVASGLALLAEYHWFLELFSHFPLHYGVAAFVLGAALALLRRWRWGAVATVVVCWNAIVAVNSLTPFQHPGAGMDAQPLTVFHFNVNFGHREPQRIIDYILAHAESIDVVVLIEATSAWHTGLRQLRTVYPHSVESLEDSPFGIALLSKAKPLATAVVAAPDGYRHIEMRLEVPGGTRPIALYAIHPPPPVSAYMADARNAKLDYIARAVRERPDETAVVVGDFNLTPYSPHFMTFVHASGLKPVKSSLLPEPTWPAAFGLAWAGISIDHSFVDPNTTVVSRIVGPDLGSDHLPITLTLVSR